MKKNIVYMFTTYHLPPIGVTHIYFTFTNIHIFFKIYNLSYFIVKL